MALQGTLDTFSLPDVLRLLAATSKTGRLRIEGDRGQGSVWLHNGKVVDAAADRAMDRTPADEVTFELLRFESGSFVFETDEKATDAGSPQEVDDLLRKASSLLGEWRELEAVVPSLAHQVTLSADLSADEVTIDADRWRSVVAVAAGHTVGELATSLELTELGVSRAVRDLVELGVAEIGKPELVPDPPRRPERSPLGAGATPAPIAGDRRPLVPPDAVSVEGQRAGWLTADRTGETPAVRVEPHGGANGASSAGAGPKQPPSRVGRRGPGQDAANGGSSPTLRANEGGRGRRASGETGRTPAVRPGDTGRGPVVRPTDVIGPDDTGRTPIARPGDTGRGPAVRPGDTGHTPMARPGDTGHTPMARPGDTGRTPMARPGDTGRTPMARPGDTGRGPAVRPGDTGRTPMARPGDTGRGPAVRPGDTGHTPMARPGDTGRGPAVRPGDTGRTPMARPGDSGRAPMARPGDAGRGPAVRPGDAGRSPLSGPGRAPGPGASGPAGRRDAGAPRRTSRPGPAGNGRPGEGGSPFDTGRLGPSPLPHETGQIRPVPPSSLPPDLHWAADDATSTGPISSPFSGLSSLGPSRPPLADGEVAPHVVAMSPEARAAVQSTVGNAGGSAPGRGAGYGEDVAQRSRLVSFLSSVR